jgi:hypothetical protein
MLKKKSIIFFILISLTTLITFNPSVWAAISVEIIKPTEDQLFCGMEPFTIPLKGVVHITFQD